MNYWAGVIVQTRVSGSLAVSLGLESPGPMLTPHLASKDLQCFPKGLYHFTCP